MLRPRHEFPTPLFRLAVPLAVDAAVAVWAAAAISEKSWLFALVVVAVGVASTPLLLRIRTGRGVALAAVALAVGAWLVAFLVWAPFVRWE